jgi:hypothetical protein
VVTAINNTAFTVSNPTSQAAVITQIWSNHVLISPTNLEQGISPFGNFTFNYPLSLANGNFEIVTLAGNTYSGGLQSQFSEATTNSWLVTWYYNTTQPSNVTNLVNSQVIGSSYWYDLNFYWTWSVASNPIIANYNLSYQSPCTNIIGFVATTPIIKTTDSNSNGSVTFNIDTKSQIQVAIDGVLVSNPGGWYNYNSNVSFPITGSLYSEHTITIYYYMPTTSTTDQPFLKLNIVNATFAP